MHAIKTLENYIYLLTWHLIDDWLSHVVVPANCNYMSMKLSISAVQTLYLTKLTANFTANLIKMLIKC